jgi:hypothetical protein
VNESIGMPLLSISHVRQIAEEQMELAGVIFSRFKNRSNALKHYVTFKLSHVSVTIGWQ